MEKDFNWLDEYGAELFEVNQHHERFSRIIEELSQADDKAIIRRLREEVHFQWNDAYNTGVNEIDSQHKHFLEIIENVARINTGASTCSVTARLLDEVLDYAQVHFQSEEQLMKQYGYPKLASHKKEHEVLTRELHRQVGLLKESNGSSAKMLYFLLQWFLKHTLYTDQEIGRYIQEQRRPFRYRFRQRFLRLKSLRFFRRRSRR
ncbi:MAG: bacteriohemerythrin [Candidatus Electrothrix communis]|nr:MAG: bacteriohemerythrin [Candidatus Electrothrix communis]